VVKSLRVSLMLTVTARSRRTFVPDVCCACFTNRMPLCVLRKMSALAGSPAMLILYGTQTYRYFDSRHALYDAGSVSASAIQRNLREWIEEGRVRRIGTEPFQGTGKSCYIFQVVSLKKAMDLWNVSEPSLRA